MKTVSVYEIVTNPMSFVRFLNWLPTPCEGEGWYVVLVARRKYSDLVDSNRQVVLNRFIAKDKKGLFRKVKQLEVPLNTYVNKKGVGLPEESLALYIMPTPRSFKRATLAALQQIAKNIENDVYVSPHTLSLNELQKAGRKKGLVIFDMDCEGDVKQKIRERVREILNEESYDILNTRGGFHVIVNPQKVEESRSKNWYKELSEYSDVKGDILIPMPGCRQGDFTPFFENKLEPEQ